MVNTEWRVRYADPRSDSYEISRLYREVFGESYGYRQLLNSEGVEERISDDEVTGYVAEAGESDEKDVIGVGMVIEEDEKRVEFGRGAVHPDYRSSLQDGNLVIQDMMDAAFADVADSPIEMIYTRSTTYTNTIQKLFEDEGFAGVAYEKSKVPSVIADGREDTVIMTRMEDGVQYSDTVYIPEASSSLIESWASEAGLSSEAIPRYSGKESNGVSTYMHEKKMNPESDELTAVLKQAGGSSSQKIISDRIDSYLEEDLSNIEIQLNISKPGSAGTIPLLEDRGFELAGLVPGWFSGTETRQNGLLMVRARENDQPVRLTKNNKEVVKRLESERVF